MSSFGRIEMSCFRNPRMPSFAEAREGEHDGKGHDRDESKGDQASWDYSANSGKEVTAGTSGGVAEVVRSASASDCEEVSKRRRERFGAPAF